MIWVRDPWDSQDRSDVATLRIPGHGSERPVGAEGLETCSLRQVGRLSDLMRRPLLFATTARFLAAKIPSAYGLDPEIVHSLPNIINPVGAISKAVRPMVVYLARLDPTKRPWVFAALADVSPMSSLSSWDRAISGDQVHGSFPIYQPTSGRWAT